MTASNSNTVQATGVGEWSIETERHIGAHIARASAIIVAPDKPDPDASPHAKLAGARAWAAVGAQCLSADDAANAAVAARSGLKELGDDYRPNGVKDDTLMKIDAAEERITDGAAGDGASGLLRQLDTRILLYVKKHVAEVR